MDFVFRLTQRVLQFIHGSASSSSLETGKEIRDILDDLQSVRKTSAWIKAVLADAEERALRGEELVKVWLTDLHHLNYRAADLLGLYEYEVAAQQIRDEEASATAAAKGKRKLDQVYNSSPLADSSFRQEFAHGVRKFWEDFDHINKLKEALPFDIEDGEKAKPKDCNMIEYLPTGSEPVDDLFFGREDKLRELIEYLLSDSIKVENDLHSKYVPVIALVGMGGVGKTTLAQHAFKDPKVCKFYSKKGWVCVSDNFHVPRVTKLTLEALNEISDDEESSALQTRLKDIAKKSKFLLVLDDVWNENMAPWDTFYSSVRDGAKGSKIIITTRSKTVACTAQAMKCIDVECLSNEDAWKFFQTVVFGDHGNRHELDHAALTDVGKKITERCKGLPLAIKVLGRYLRYYNEDLQIWNEVLESNLLQPDVLGEGNQVWGPLLLSYLHLPACLKPCLVLSSVFPKDTLIRKKKLIKLWIAHELVEDCNENTGMLYIQNLVARSFFEICKDYMGEYLTIHDIIHDLATHLSRDKMLYKTSDDDQGNTLLISEEVQHAFISYCNVPAVQLKFGITDTSGLRTLHVSGGMEKLIVDPNPVNLNSLRSLKLYNDAYYLHEYLKRLKNLRHLNLQRRFSKAITKGEFDAIGTFYNLRILKIKFLSMLTENGISFPVCICNLKRLICLSINGIKDVPASIGCLTKLWKLHLSGLHIECLPDTISKLVNLRVLKLTLCRSLIKLPASIGELKALEVLKLDGCRALTKLPASILELKALEVLGLHGCALKGLPIGIKRLTKLQRLVEFRVPPREFVVNEEAAGIEELRELVCIRGNLVIDGLENVATKEEAKQSELNNKRHIRLLRLEWSHSPQAQDEKVLQGLRPHANLEKLQIDGWSGRRLASWLGDTSFVNLKEIGMENIPNCKSLTPIHHLPSLRYLYCSNMASLLCLMPASFLFSDSDIRNSCFPALEMLILYYCPSLVAIPDSMPLSKHLQLMKCGSVRALPDSLPSLKKLRIVDCSSLRFSDSIVFRSSLRRLRITRCPQLVNWCRVHRQSKLAHLPYVEQWRHDNIQLSNIDEEWSDHESSDEEWSDD